MTAVIVITLLVYSIVGKSGSVIAAGTIPPLLSHDLIWNIESVYYYINSSATSYATPIGSAAYNWVHTGYGWNNLYPNTRTYNISNSTIDIYGYNNVDGYNGYTTFWARTNGHSGTAFAVDPDQNDWLYNEIYLNGEYLNTITKQRATTCHEMGHCFGLDENNTNQYSIMCQESAERQVNVVQQRDHIAFNNKHP